MTLKGSPDRVSSLMVVSSGVGVFSWKTAKFLFILSFFILFPDFYKAFSVVLSKGVIIKFHFLFENHSIAWYCSGMDTGVRAVGFSSPAVEFAEPALNFQQLLIAHPTATFVMKCDADILVVDRSLTPRRGGWVVTVVDGQFVLMEFSDLVSFVWGVVTYRISSCLG